jgi:hypothetical protein
MLVNGGSEKLIHINGHAVFIRTGPEAALLGLFGSCERRRSD